MEHETVKKWALVADDDDIMLSFISTVLKREGYQVESVADGMAALQFCQAEPVDLIVTDVRMPRLSGTSFFSNLRLTMNKDTPVIVVSALSDAKIRQQALAAGAKAFLQKPFTQAQLLAAITTALDTGKPA